MDEELKTYLDGKFGEVKEYIDERTRDMQTELLRGFANYNESIVIRMRKLEADQNNLDASTSPRLGKLEEQITDLVIRVLKLEGKPPVN